MVFGFFDIIFQNFLMLFDGEVFFKLPPLVGRIRFRGSKANLTTEDCVYPINEADARAGGERCKVEIFSHLPRSTFCP